MSRPPHPWHEGRLLQRLADGRWHFRADVARELELRDVTAARLCRVLAERGLLVVRRVGRAPHGPVLVRRP